MDAILGMLVFSLGGLAGATFLLPARGVKGWAYESWWLVYVFVGHLVCPTLICYFTVPDFWNVITSAPGTVIAQCVFFGAIWGVGGLTWGLMVRYLGIGLGLAIGCGLCAATGTLIPPIAQGHAADLVKDAGAITVLAGVMGSLLGIVFVGLAGKIKENELPEEEKKKAVAEFNFKKGMIVAVVSGVCSACMNFGLQSGGVIEKAAYDAAVKAGVVSAGALFPWQGMPVIMVVLWGGFTVSALWCFQQNFIHKTFGDYARPSVRNVVLCAAIGVVWVMQFVCTKAGEPLMGELKYISFAVMMASTILFSTIIGAITGEWKGTSGKTKGCLALGLAILIVSFCAISLGSK
ncbi:MAG: rhamnose/proton symporter RhaT [Kiritimatiellae bacterium]|nr:rhamnose/proton symporter RhaT [Kiritimatiellia bacterium]